MMLPCGDVPEYGSCIARRKQKCAQKSSRATVWFSLVRQSSRCRAGEKYEEDCFTFTSYLPCSCFNVSKSRQPSTCQQPERHHDRPIHPDIHQLHQLHQSFPVLHE